MFSLTNPNPKFNFTTSPHLTKIPSIFSQKNRSLLVNFTVAASHVAKRRCDLYDLHKELVPYGEAWSWQKDILNEKIVKIEKSEDFPDSLIVLQHHPVYTLGTGSSLEFLKFDVKDPPFDLHRTKRGGEVTYHGPGQLVMYPIINLRYQKMDLQWYLGALEEVVIRALSSTFGIEASRVEGLTGVWVGNQKLAAVGIRASRWITLNGLALNVTTDLTPFQQIVPCGIRDRQVGSIKGLLKENFLSKEFAEEDDHQLGDNELIDMTHRSLIREFCEVFQVDLQYKSVQIKKPVTLSI